VNSDLRLFAKAEWRARWRAQLLSAVVVAVTVGAVLAMLLGADRSETAFDRLRATANASDATLFLPEGEDDLALERVDALRLPGVVAASAFAEPFVRPKGTELVPDYDLYPIVRFDGAPDAVNRAVITSGRAVDPNRPDEVVLSEALAKSLGLHAGDPLQLESVSDAYVDIFFAGGDPGPPDGPLVDATIVGIERTPADLGRYKGTIEVTPAYVERYGSQIHAVRSIHARLSSGVDPRALMTDRGSASDTSAFGDDASTDDGLDTIAKALRLVAVAAALAGIGAIAIAYNRACRVALQDRSTLSAMGWSARRQQTATTLALCPSLFVAVPLGAVLGSLTSRYALVGLAERIDPRPASVEINWGLAGAVVATSLAIGLLVLIISAQRTTSLRPTPVARVPTGGLWHPLSVSIGVRHAFFTAPRYGGRASRAALTVATICVAAIVAALSVSASIGNLRDDPSLTGQGGALAIDSGEALDVFDRALPLLERDDRVAMLAGLHVIFDLSADSLPNVTAGALDIVRGDPGLSIVRGRSPYQPDEVALGPTTLERLGKSVGEMVTLSGPTGRADYSIVGTMLFPEGDFSHDDGVAISVEGAARVAGDVRKSAALHQVIFDWASGVDAAAAEAELAAGGFELLTTERGLAPPSVTNLDQVRSLPIALAVFLGLLPLGALTQAIATSTKMQHREFATLRALGATTRTVASLVVVHGVVITIAAIAVGIPAGAVLGAQVWRPIADSANVVVDTITPWRWVSTMVGVSVISTGLLVVPMAVSAKARRPAQYLQAE
jgi:hypothetical protein